MPCCGRDWGREHHMSNFSFLINSYCEAKLSLRVSAALMLVSSEHRWAYLFPSTRIMSERTLIPALDSAVDQLHTVLRSSSSYVRLNRVVSTSLLFYKLPWAVGVCRSLADSGRRRDLTRQRMKRPRGRSSGRLSGFRSHTSTEAIRRLGILQVQASFDSCHSKIVPGVRFG